jgi:hypothetical protein
MRFEIHESARSRMQLEVSAQPELLVGRAGKRAQQKRPKNPNESVNEQLPSLAATNSMLQLRGRLRNFSAA